MRYPVLSQHNGDAPFGNVPAPDDPAELLGAGRVREAPLQLIPPPGPQEPAETDADGRHRKPLPVQPIGSIGFRRLVKGHAVRKDTSLAQLVERIDEDLSEEEQQEEARHLEEQLEVDQMAALDPEDR